MAGASVWCWSGWVFGAKIRAKHIGDTARQINDTVQLVQRHCQAAAAAIPAHVRASFIPYPLIDFIQIFDYFLNQLFSQLPISAFIDIHMNESCFVEEYHGCVITLQMNQCGPLAMLWIGYI